MRVALAGTEFTNDALKLGLSDCFTLSDPLIKEWSEAEGRFSKMANSGEEVILLVFTSIVASDEKPNIAAAAAAD